MIFFGAAWHSLPFHVISPTYGIYRSGTYRAFEDYTLTAYAYDQTNTVYDMIDSDIVEVGAIHVAQWCNHVHEEFIFTVSTGSQRVFIGEEVWIWREIVWRA